MTDREIEFLFDQIRKLREKNVSIIYISHKMDELSQIADSITIMRDGYHILTKAFNEITYDETNNKAFVRDVKKFLKAD